MSEQIERVTSEAEAIEVKRRTARQDVPKQWRAFVVPDLALACTFANVAPPCVAGEALISFKPGGDIGLLLFY